MANSKNRYPKRMLPTEETQVPAVTVETLTEELLDENLLTEAEETANKVLVVTEPQLSDEELQNIYQDDSVFDPEKQPETEVVSELVTEVVTETEAEAE